MCSAGWNIFFSQILFLPPAVSQKVQNLSSAVLRNDKNATDIYLSMRKGIFLYRFFLCHQKTKGFLEVPSALWESMYSLSSSKILYSIFTVFFSFLFWFSQGMHSQESAIYLFLHTWAHRHSWLASVAVIDIKGRALPSLASPNLPSWTPVELAVASLWFKLAIY